MSDSLQPHRLYSLPSSSVHGFSRKNTGVGCYFLLQGIFPTQGWNPHLLRCRWILYHWDSGKPIWCVFVHKKIAIFSINARLVVIRYYRTEVGEIGMDGRWRDIGILECETSPLKRLALVGVFNRNQWAQFRITEESEISVSIPVAPILQPLGLAASLVTAALSTRHR